MKVFITGGSHIGALYRAYKADEGKSVPPDIQVLIRPLGGGLTVAKRFFDVKPRRIVITSPKFRKHFTQIPLQNFRCDTIGLCTTLYSRPIWSNGDWAKFGPLADLAGRQMVSEALIRRLVHDDTRHLIDFLLAARGLGIRPFVIDCPRPFRHNPEVRIAGEKTIRHLDENYRRIMAGKLEALDIPVVANPPDTCDADGFTLPRFRHTVDGDRTHANVEYGHKMLDRIYAFLASSNG